MIDFANLTAEQRLLLIQNVLGLMPSGRDWEGRATYLCFLIAGESPPERIQSALKGLEAVRPGWFEERVLPFAKDMHDLRLPEVEMAR